MSTLMDHDTTEAAVVVTRTDVLAREGSADPAPDVRQGWTVIALLFAAIALLASLVAVGYGMRAVEESKASAGAAGAAAASAPSTVKVHLSEFRIEPAVVTVAAGGTLEVLNSVGAVPHNLAVKKTTLETPTIPAGGSGSLALGDLAPGTYELYCHIAGHEESGMKATMNVVAGGATAAAAPAPGMDHGGAKRMTADEMDAQMAVATKAFPQKTEGLGAQILAPTLLADGTKQFELTTKVARWEVEAGKVVDAWTYNGTVPGPTIRVQPGDRVRVVVRNELPESTAIHFHGLMTPNDQDGVPDITQAPIKPATTYTYEFTAQAKPTVGMYHSHQNAVEQVPNGLAGAIFVGDMPVPSGVTVGQEHVMMVNDSGVIGFSLNGKSFPATAPIVAKKGEWVKVHYMNEGAMVHPMHLHGMGQLVIAKDGFQTPQPYEADTILVGPGERYTVLVHAELVGTWAWHCHVLSHAETAEGMFGMVTALVVQP